MEQLVITYDEMLHRTPLADRLRSMLKLLEKHYKTPVDTEFTAHIVEPNSAQPGLEICLLQCRPQSRLKEISAHLPQALFPEDIVFSTQRMVPQGTLTGIRLVVFVPPEGYYALPTTNARSELTRAIGKLNALLADETFICVGPGRWGTINPDLGVSIAYGDIYNTRALVEVTGKGLGPAPEPSFGTHFFQDLVESNIYPLAVYLDDEDAIFNRRFFYDTPNALTAYLPKDAARVDTLRVIEVAAFRPGHHIKLVMDDEQGRAVAFLAPD